jgi:hypothetical protein
MGKQRITNGFEYFGGARDGENISYRFSDLVIRPSDSIVTGEEDDFEKGVQVKREHTQVRPFSLEDQASS